MKPKKTTPSKPKLSFTVDRSEFDISSDWVQAVMAPPSLPAREAPFFSPPINNATDAEESTGANAVAVPESDAVSKIAAVSESVPVLENVSGAENAVTVAKNAPVENTATVAVNISEEQNAPVVKTVAVINDPPVDENATVINPAAVANNASRLWKLRPLRRITDGLTPGQYAVYSLMLESCETTEGGEQLYRGGYADLGRLTGLSKRGIQNVIGELQEKAVIRLHTAPGHHRMQTSAYLVPRPESVLQTWYGRGWRYAVGKSKKLTDGSTVALLTMRGAA